MSFVERNRRYVVSPSYDTHTSRVVPSVRSVPTNGNNTLYRISSVSCLSRTISSRPDRSRTMWYRSFPDLFSSPYILGVPRVPTCGGERLDVYPTIDGNCVEKSGVDTRTRSWCVTPVSVYSLSETDAFGDRSPLGLVPCLTNESVCC